MNVFQCLVLAFTLASPATSAVARDAKIDPAVLTEGFLAAHPDLRLRAEGVRSYEKQDYAIALTEFARQHRIMLPEPLGPTSKADLPPDLRAFVDEKLEPALRKAAEKNERAEQARRDLARLQDAEGKWPDYPKAVMELSRQYKLVVPGWMLPGKSEIWDRLRGRWRHWAADYLCPRIHDAGGV